MEVPIINLAYALRDEPSWLCFRKMVSKLKQSNTKVILLQVFQSSVNKEIDPVRDHAEKFLISNRLLQNDNPLDTVTYSIKKDNDSDEFLSYVTLRLLANAEENWVQKLFIALKNSKMYKSPIFLLVDDKKIQSISKIQKGDKEEKGVRTCCLTKKDLTQLSANLVSQSCSGNKTVIIENQSSCLEETEKEDGAESQRLFPVLREDSIIPKEFLIENWYLVKKNENKDTKTVACTSLSLKAKEVLYCEVERLEDEDEVQEVLRLLEDNEKRASLIKDNPKMFIQLKRRLLK